mmetsp:Transcript_13190/g.21577  ORF Transcript_13190/g.21577 Transcript_13190/m.21577 type:complete len:329 (-) Transcript_13190:1329-2315(-)
MDLNETLTLFMRDFVAGGFSGVLAKTVVAPIERVKLLLQTQAVNARISQTKTYSGGIACLKDLIEKEGVLALWRGNTANVIRYFPNQAFNFALKDKFRRFLGVSTSPGSEGKQNMQMAIVMWNNVIAGSAAGATTSLLTYPLDMARTRLATDISLSAVQGQGKGQRQFSGVWDCVRQSYVEGGLLRVYRGFPLSICGAALFRGLFFGGYDNLKYGMNLDEASFFKRYMVAQTLTTVVGTFCYPIDTIKRRMMIQTNFDNSGASVGEGSGAAASKKGHMNGRECLRYILRTEGVRGLYSGLGINLIRGVSGALLLVCYDEAKKVTYSKG